MVEGPLAAREAMAMGCMGDCLGLAALTVVVAWMEGGVMMVAGMEVAGMVVVVKEAGTVVEMAAVWTAAAARAVAAMAAGMAVEMAD